MASSKYCVSAEDIHTDQAGFKVNAEAGRKCVRAIYQYPILSKDWSILVEHLRQLARLVTLEGRMQPDEKVAATQGRNSDSGGTLWDQEAQEHAIRILVEEAKVNLCLRMISEYKKWSYEPTRQSSVKHGAAVLGVSEAQLEMMCLQYEETLGLLLERAFEHVETLQLIDIPLLVEHVAMVLDVTMKAGIDLTCASKGSQEYQALHYFASLMRHSEALKKPELLARARDFQLIPLVTQHILRHAQNYTPEITANLCKGLAAMADNEDFNTEWEEFFLLDGAPDRDAVASFVQLEAVLVSPLLETHRDPAAARRELRPLLDLFKKMSRVLK
jgi:hypothetical protein